MPEEEGVIRIFGGYDDKTGEVKINIKISKEIVNEVFRQAGNDFEKSQVMFNRLMAAQFRGLANGEKNNHGEDHTSAQEFVRTLLGEM